MSRSIPWRNKPTESEQRVIQSVDEGGPSLLLLQELGPTQFVVKGNGDSERDKIKHKVSIGDLQRCTCHKKPRLCQHIVFVMLKVLRVPAENPIIWQLSLTEQEINQV